MNENTQQLIAELVAHESKIPFQAWQQVLWLYRGSTRKGAFLWFGITRKGTFLRVGEDGVLRYVKQTTFLKEWTIEERGEHAIQERVKDYLLFLKGANLTLQDIASCRNVEVRRLLIAQYGYDKLLKQAHGKIIHKDGTSELIQVDLREGREFLCLLKVQDTTTHETYVLRVPPYMRTCKQAVAWTFGMQEEEYIPLKES